MKGWYGDRLRHKLASKGIQTGVDLEGKFKLYEVNEQSPIISAHFEVEQVIYVPSTDSLQRTISVEEMEKRIQEVRYELSKLFGGYTSVEGIGGFVKTSEKGEELIEEPVTRIISYTTREGFEENSELLIEYLERKRQEWGQISMGYEIEGDMYYIGETRW